MEVKNSTFEWSSSQAKKEDISISIWAGKSTSNVAKRKSEVDRDRLLSSQSECLPFRRETGNIYDQTERGQNDEANLPTDSLNRKKRKMVKFSSTSQIKVIGVSDHQGSISDSWFSKKEMRQFKKDTLLSVLIIRKYYAKHNALPIEHDDVSIHGIEGLLWNSSAREVLEARKHVKVAVLSEQRRQNEMGVFCPDAISNISLECSGWSKERAHKIGKMHEFECKYNTQPESKV